MTGAWFKATGQALSFSEQQIVDCSWDYEVDGCWGGEMQPALEYINKAGECLCVNVEGVFTGGVMRNEEDVCLCPLRCTNHMAWPTRRHIPD